MCPFLPAKPSRRGAPPTPARPAKRAASLFSNTPMLERGLPNWGIVLTVARLVGQSRWHTQQKPGAFRRGTLAMDAESDPLAGFWDIEHHPSLTEAFLRQGSAASRSGAKRETLDAADCLAAQLSVPPGAPIPQRVSFSARLDVPAPSGDEALLAEARALAGLVSPGAVARRSRATMSRRHGSILYTGTLGLDSSVLSGPLSGLTTPAESSDDDSDDDGWSSGKQEEASTKDHDRDVVDRALELLGDAEAFDESGSVVGAATGRSLVRNRRARVHPWGKDRTGASEVSAGVLAEGKLLIESGGHLERLARQSRVGGLTRAANVLPRPLDPSELTAHLHLWEREMRATEQWAAGAQLYIDGLVTAAEEAEFLARTDTEGETPLLHTGGTVRALLRRLLSAWESNMTGAAHRNVILRRLGHILGVPTSMGSLLPCTGAEADRYEIHRRDPRSRLAYACQVLIQECSATETEAGTGVSVRDMVARREAVKQALRMLAIQAHAHASALAHVRSQGPGRVKRALLGSRRPIAPPHRVLHTRAGPPPLSTRSDPVPPSTPRALSTLDERTMDPTTPAASEMGCAPAKRTMGAHPMSSKAVMELRVPEREPEGSIEPLVTLTAGPEPSVAQVFSPTSRRSLARGEVQPPAGESHEEEAPVAGAFTGGLASVLLAIGGVRSVPSDEQHAIRTALRSRDQELQASAASADAVTRLTVPPGVDPATGSLFSYVSVTTKNPVTSATLRARDRCLDAYRRLTALVSTRLIDYELTTGRPFLWRGIEYFRSIRAEVALEGLREDWKLRKRALRSM
jgi:hypothetical protein